MAKYTIRIVAQSSAQLKALEGRSLELHRRAAREEGPSRFTVPAVADDVALAQLRTDGYGIEDVRAVDQMEADRRSHLLQKRRRAADLRARGVTGLDAVTRAIDGYLSPEEVENALQSLATAYPDTSQVILLPYATWEGRRSHAIRIHDRINGTPGAPGILITGSAHAREWGGSDICVSFAARLLAAHASASGLTFGAQSYPADVVAKILQGLDIFVFADVNPDGKHHSQNNEIMWRKNRNPNGGAEGPDVGVDLNRNFDFLWDSGIGSSQVPSLEIYRGEAPFSEPESQNVRHLFDTFPNIAFFVDIHSFGELIMYSWGDDDSQSSDPSQNFQNAAFDGMRGIVRDGVYREYIPPTDLGALTDFANVMRHAIAGVRGQDYDVRPAVGLYPTTASADDYAFSRQFEILGKPKIYGFTIEFGREFIPPFDEMKKIIDDIGAALTALCAEAAAS